MPPDQIENYAIHCHECENKRLAYDYAKMRLEHLGCLLHVSGNLEEADDETRELAAKLIKRELQAQFLPNF